MRLPQTLLAALGLSLAATAALAQDAATQSGPQQPPPNTADAPPPPGAGPAPVAAPGAFDWSGPYIGINAGAAFDGSTRFRGTTGQLANNTASLATGLRPTDYTLNDAGFTGGMQIGYNYEIGKFMGRSFGGVVAGLEADAAYTYNRDNETTSNTTMLGPLVTPSTTAYTRLNQYESNLRYLGTVRGRLGYATNTVFLYGTGGFAYGGVDRSVTFYGPNAPTTAYFQGADSGIRTGFAYGGGIEFALGEGFPHLIPMFHSSAATLKLEYLRYDLGSETLDIPGVGPGAGLGGYATSVRTRGELARVGLNYKF